jgi:ComF family protein
VCALPSPAGATCGACLRRPPPFALTRIAWRYAFPVDRLMHAFKYGGRLALAEPLAEGLAQAVARASSEVDAIVPLPLAPTRQRERGFNQAREIARRIAPRVDVPLLDALARVRDGAPQASLKWRERARHVRGAFALRADVRGRRVALVDDVMTTGATLTSAARELRKGGAAHVELWVVARTLPPGQDGR